MGVGEVWFDASGFVLQVINLAAICTPADYNTRPLDTIYSNFVDALPVVQYCRENGKRLIHFSTCEVYGKTIGSFLPKDSPLKKVGHCWYLLCNLSRRTQIQRCYDGELWLGVFVVVIEIIESMWLAVGAGSCVLSFERRWDSLHFWVHR